MSHKVNEEWIAAAYEHFQGAVEVGNYSLALDIIQDTLDQGFKVEGNQMLDELHDLPLSAFAVKSPYQ